MTAPRECQWTVSSQANWLRVSPGSGQGDTTLTVTADANPTASQRSGSVAVNGQMFTLMQAGADCRLGVSPVSIEIGADGGRRNVQVTAPGGCTWTSTSGVDWVTAATPSGSGQGTASFDIDENTSSARRTNVQVAGQTVAILQSVGRPREEPTPPPSQPPTTPPPTNPPTTPPPVMTPPPLPPPQPPPPTQPPCDKKGKGGCKGDE